MITTPTNESQVIENFIKKLLAHLDECNVDKLQLFPTLFDQHSCKIIVNSQPFAQPAAFIQTWLQQVVATQHSITSIDFHTIPGTNTVICNVNCKVRFEESGRDRSGADSAILVSSSTPSSRNNMHSKGSLPSRNQRIWGSYYGVSIQIVLHANIFTDNPPAGVIAGLNYNFVYKPEDSLITI
ncbi:HCL193Cp [Eremothecium sinecaudum]|uniref:HCL193Cp n=1 Tax=Eremothecium sinecaudum TaxID=45286 RepID=A0A0X8HR95_9SACH|nr:HCL193Cp [Eremothecium sinecaudum]AMD19958.1 HCL193Cp [Eremothecium sinecaudum]